VGETLTANTDLLDGIGTISYQWNRIRAYGEISPIPGANSSTYTVQNPGDVYQWITVTVTRSGYSGSVTSEQTIQVPMVILLGDITVSPATTVCLGTTLTATYNGPETVSYSWSRAGTLLSVNSECTTGTTGNYTVTVSGPGGYSPKTVTVTVRNHDYQWVETTAPTFIEAGVETYQCSYDHSHTNGTRPGNDPLPITSTAEWETAHTQLTGKTGEYTLTISSDSGIGVAGITTNSFGTTADGSSLSVTLKGSGRLYLTSQGIILRVAARQTLIIDSEELILEGLTNGKNGATQDNNSRPVYVGGTLELRKGTISGNTVGSSSSASGAGVYVASTGTFTMHGGAISGNTSGYTGGGVYVGGTFMMHGGVISGNITGRNNSGGGVYVTSTGTFTMNGGVISGNTANGSISGYGGGGVAVDGGIFHIVKGTIYGRNEGDLSNTGGFGAALFVNGGTAQRGTFTGENDAWVSKATLYTDNNTIKVEDGNIVP
jgi:hypothetical protein